MIGNLWGQVTLLSVLPAGENDVGETVVQLLIQLAVILFAAKVAGELTARFLNLPTVLAEVGIGVVIGPFALGAIGIPGFGPLFPQVGGPIPVSSELFAIAQIGSIVLLFSIGLEANLRQFLHYAGPASAVAVGGVVVPFVLGAGATVLFVPAVEGFFSPEALFMGAIMTATSVGITARVLADLRRLHQPEGVTILAAAVVDDVLGILVLTVVVGASAADSLTAVGEASATGSFSMGDLGWVAAKAIGFWLGLTAVGIWTAPYIERLINRLRTPGAGLVLMLALAFLAAGMAELAGLAFIIGAFSIGLALSTTELGHRVGEETAGINQFLVPVFFVVMGMLVDVGSMLNAVVFGLILSVLAILSKVFGCGIPALATRFNFLGSARIGVGMTPRGEVALIIAGIGLSQGIIGQELFGVSIMMTIITTLIAPVVLIRLFGMEGTGLRRRVSGTSLETPVAASPDSGDTDD